MQESRVQDSWLRDFEGIAWLWNLDWRARVLVVLLGDLDDCHDIDHHEAPHNVEFGCILDKVLYQVSHLCSLVRLHDLLVRGLGNEGLRACVGAKSLANPHEVDSRFTCFLEIRDHSIQHNTSNGRKIDVFGQKAGGAWIGIEEDLVEGCALAPDGPRFSLLDLEAKVAKLLERIVLHGCEEGIDLVVGL
jgi:hypothetical protein